MVYVYEQNRPPPVSFPFITAEAKAAKERVMQRLKDVRRLTGNYKWDSKAFRLHDKWYKECYAYGEVETNPIMKGYLSSKNVQLYKVMMALDVCSDNPSLQFTESLLEEGLMHLDLLDPGMLLLFSASGKNELLYGQRMVITFLEKNGDWVSEAALKRMLESELNPMETFSVLRHLEDTDQVIKRNIGFPKEGERWGFTTPQIYKKKNENNTRTANENGKVEPNS